VLHLIAVTVRHYESVKVTAGHPPVPHLASGNAARCAATIGASNPARHVHNQRIGRVLHGSCAGGVLPAAAGSTHPAYCNRIIASAASSQRLTLMGIGCTWAGMFGGQTFGPIDVLVLPFAGLPPG